MRTVPEWVGKKVGSAIPPRVRVRIWEREKGRCHLSGRQIRTGEPWDLDHRVALINGGTHSESNLFPALRDKHREKTAQDVREKAIVYRKKAKHLGVTVEKRKMQGPGFRKVAPQRSASRPLEKRND